MSCCPTKNFTFKYSQEIGNKVEIIPEAWYLPALLVKQFIYVVGIIVPLI